MERRQPIMVKDAIEKVMKWTRSGSVEWVPINECDNRFLGEPLRAEHDVPHFDRSPYDGFAIRSEDTLHATKLNPVTFDVIDEIGAGQVSSQKVGKFQAVRIMTGAALPQGSDCVIMLELVKEEQIDSRKIIKIKRKVKTGENVSYKGEDVKEGECLIKQGTMITPGVKALLATFGYSSVPVIKKPIIGLIATGSELLDVDDPLEHGKIRNSNGYMIESQIIRAGGQVRKYETRADEVESLLSSIETALMQCDYIITTGGVSVGDFDYLPEIYTRLGATVLFNKIAMRPGSVTTVAVIDDKLLFGLSGNPSACFVGFELYVRPIIRTWLHSEKPYLTKAKATLLTDFPKPNPFNRFVRSQLQFNEDRLFVDPVGIDKSNIVSSIAWSNCLMVLPGSTRGYKAGDLVDVLLFEDQTGSEEPWGEVR